MEAANSRLRQLRLDGRFTKMSAVHLTLKFLGNIKESQVNGISRVLDESVRMTERFCLHIEKIGVFPNRKRPRIIWTGIREEPGLLQLQQRVELGLQQLGFAAEKRPFQPHLTMVRLKSLRNVSELRLFLDLEAEGLSFGSFEVDAVHLYQSILLPTGAEYRKLATHSL
jgi:2'-5' RNA ligase